MPAGPRAVTLPPVVAHADWGCDPRKRQIAVAELTARSGRPRYEVVSVAPVPRHGADVFDVLAASGGPGRSLVGFDFTIGLPRDYAAAVGVTSFPAFLDLIGSGPWQEFEHVAERAGDISLHRPFYPRRPGGTRRADLYEGLGLSAGQLRRRGDGSDAETLFWTLGPKQAGKASLDGWRLLRRARAKGADIALWPFDGSLFSLLAGNTRTGPAVPAAGSVVAEAYPREFYRWIGAPPAARWSKRRRDDRLMCVPRLLAWAESLGVGWAADVRARVTAGLCEGPAGEDEFDCVVGVLGMISVVTSAIPVGLPADDPAVLTTEGWMLGRASDGRHQPGPQGSRRLPQLGIEATRQCRRDELRGDRGAIRGRSAGS
jgi:hypothetical protein